MKIAPFGQWLISYSLAHTSSTVTSSWPMCLCPSSVLMISARKPPHALTAKASKHLVDACTYVSHKTRVTPIGATKGISGLHWETVCSASERGFSNILNEFCPSSCSSFLHWLTSMMFIQHHNIWTASTC